MKLLVVLFLIAFTVQSCSSESQKNKKTEISSTSEKSSDNGSVSAEQKKPVRRNTDGEWNQEDCVRSIPEAICNPKAFKNHSFRLDTTSGPVYIGYEKATLKNGDVLEIQNCGCEYYILEFTFTTSRFKGDTTDLVYWCDAAIQLLKSVDKSISGGINVTEGYEVMQKYYLESESPALGVQQPVNDSEIGTYVSIERIEKVSKSKYAITVHYAVGPL